MIQRNGIKGGGGTRAKKIDKYRQFLEGKVDGGSRGKNFTIGEACRLVHIFCDPELRLKLAGGLHMVTSNRANIESGHLKMTVFDEPVVDGDGFETEGGVVWQAFHDEGRVYSIVDFDMVDFPLLYKVNYYYYLHLILKCDYGCDCNCDCDCDRE